MSKFTAIACTIMLHFVFVTGLAAASATAAHIVADRAEHVWTA
jgi:hypothetical protein